MLKLYRQDREGIAAVEFALMAPALLLMLIGAFDFGSYINVQMKLENTARASAQYILEGGDIDSIQDDVVTPSGLSSLGTVASSAEFVCECSDGTEVSCEDGECDDDDYVRHFIEVTLSMDYEPNFDYPFLPSTMELGGFARLQTSNDG